MSKLPRGIFIFVAENVMKDAGTILKIHSGKGIVIYNGVPAIESNSKNSIGPLIILMPARVSTAKDHHSLISAFELVNDNNSRLIFCGAGTETPEFINLARQLAPRNHQHISFLGQRSDVVDIYSQCNVVALISNFEALPLSIIEAMSCAKAIIASEVGGVPELIKNEINGLLVRQNCVSDIVEALIKCRDKYFRERLGTRAQLTYFEKFTENLMLSSISNTYSEMVNRYK